MIRLKRMSLSGRSNSKHEMDKRAALPSRRPLEAQHNSMIPIEVAKYRMARRSPYQTINKLKSIKRDETKRYDQPFVDFGTIRLLCGKGQIRLELFTVTQVSGLPESQTRFSETTIKETGTAQMDFPEGRQLPPAQVTVIRTNRAIVTGLADESSYTIDLASGKV